MKQLKLEKIVNLPLKVIATVFSVCFLGMVLSYSLLSPYFKYSKQFSTSPSAPLSSSPRGIMILIEQKDTKGLVNMVNELYKRDIHSLLHVGPDFVENNCQEIKKLSDYNVSLVGGCGDPLWDLTYEEQKKVITDVKQRIEACTGEPLEFITSRYWGWDDNTVKIADELGIKTIFARGTVGNGAAIYQPENYNVKILSVSNIEAVPFKYGSVCDYSYWVRDGVPSDMIAEIDDAIANHNKVSFVSHTNIGGYKKDWLNMWLKVFDTKNINWVSWEDFATVDYKMPLNRIPSNKNVPYTPAMKESRDNRYLQGENVANPCAVEELPAVKQPNQPTSAKEKEKIFMFHNNQGPMCIEAKEFFQTLDYPVEEVLTTEEDFYSRLNNFKADYSQSEGVSEDFSYYPIIFAGGKAYSGFNEAIRQELQKLAD